MKKQFFVIFFAIFSQLASADFTVRGLPVPGSEGQVLTVVSGKWAAAAAASSGITTLNTLTGATQTFATGTTGTDFGISSSGTTHTFNIPSASGTNRGLLTSADWTTFNTKGDFSGPASSTDLAIVKFNGTGGKTGQNSGVTIDADNFLLYTNTGGANNVRFSAYSRNIYLNQSTGSTAKTNSVGGGNHNTVIGHGAGNDTSGGGSNNVYIGKDAGISTYGSSNVLVGANSFTNSTQNRVVCVGAGTSALFCSEVSDTVVLGYDQNATVAGQFVVGNSSTKLNDFYFSDKVINTAPVAVTFQPSGGSGTNVAGGNITIAGGKGTGNAAPGNVLIATPTAGASGTTLQSLTTRITVSPTTATYTVPIITADSSDPANPSISINQTNLGFFRPATNAIGVSTAGVEHVRFGTASLIIDVPISAGSGTVSAPDYSWSGDLDNGLYRIGANNPALSAGGIKVIDMKSTGVAIKGTNTNDSATAGDYGETLRCSVAPASAVSLTTATPANICSISVTPGNYTVCGSINFIPAGTTSVTQLISSVSLTSATLPATSTKSNPVAGEISLYKGFEATVMGTDFSDDISCYELKLASTTTHYLVAQATFTVSTMTANGYVEFTRKR